MSISLIAPRLNVILLSPLINDGTNLVIDFLQLIDPQFAEDHSVLGIQIFPCPSQIKIQLLWSYYHSQLIILVVGFLRELNATQMQLRVQESVFIAFYFLLK